MRLCLLSEAGRFPSIQEGATTFKKAVRKASPLLKDLKKSKRKHSIRVAKRLHKAGADDQSVMAGLAHDFVEQGGDEDDLEHLPKPAIPVVYGLSDKSKSKKKPGNRPLIHLRSTLTRIPDRRTRNRLILVKLSDRVDNLLKRLSKDGKIGKRYRERSCELACFLKAQYSGPREPFALLWDELEEVLGDDLHS